MKDELKSLIHKTYNCRKRRLARRYAVRNVSREKGGIAFIGDSIVEFMPVRAFFGKTAYNLGIVGETSDYTLRRFDSNCLRLKPSKIFLLIGTNDYRRPADGHTAENIRAMILKAKTACPSAKFFVLAILPINEKILLPPFRREQSFMDRTNAEIAAMLKEFPEVVFLDTARELRDASGALSEAYTRDGLHPNREGYLLMKKALDAALEGTEPQPPEARPETEPNGTEQSKI